MRYELPRYETQDEHQHKNLPDEAEHKLGSAQPDVDPVDAVADPAIGRVSKRCKERAQSAAPQARASHRRARRHNAN